MYKRDIAAEIKGLASDYPVITVTGPRQSEKTTLVRAVFPDKPYANLEQRDVRNSAQLDPRSFLEQYPDGAILDEIQHVPDLLSYIQVIVDERQVNGMFILTGSHQMRLHHAISQSLAGRTALLSLLPLSLSELSQAGIEPSLDEALLKGGFPRVYKQNLHPTKAYRNYLQTYVEKDLRELIHLRDLATFQLFLKLCAGRIGQLLNLQSLASDVGVSSHTIKHWLSILEASYIIFRLQPYYNNFGKRLIKSPKLYFTDVGLATYLLEIENTSQLSRDPLRGHLVENLVILEIMKARFNAGLDPHLYFYRDTNGREIDLIHTSGHKLIPIEIKAGKTFQPEFLKNLRFFEELAGERFEKGYLIYGGQMEQKIQSFQLLNYAHADRIIKL